MKILFRPLSFSLAVFLLSGSAHAQAPVLQTHCPVPEGAAPSLAAVDGQVRLAAVMREAMRYPGQERQVLEFYGKNAELKEQLRAPIFEEKTVDFILELAKVAEKPVTPEELLEAARKAEEADEEKPAEAATN